MPLRRITEPVLGRIPGRASRSARPQVVLHIGAMKTGTTYLQELLFANRAQLGAAGVLVPGRVFTDQSRAARDVLGMGQVVDTTAAEPDGPWASMVAQMAAYDGTASVFSMEFLSFADADRARRVVDSLAGADVHVLLTVRDAMRAIPAQWQTSCRNQGTLTFPRLLDGVKEALDGDGSKPRLRKPAALIRRTQDIGRMLEAWTPTVGPERVHVVTVPPSGSDPALLWRRVASIVGVPPEACTVEVEYTNPSLGHASTELMRLVNTELGRVDAHDHAYVIKGPLARTILGARSHLEQPIRLNRRGARLAARWNRRVRAAIKQAGVGVVGDLAELPVALPSEEVPAALYRPGPEDLLGAAATARDGLTALEQHLREQVASTTHPVDAQGDPVPAKAGFAPGLRLPSVVPAAWEASADPVAAAVQQVAAQVRECIEANREVEEAAWERRLHGLSPPSPEAAGTSVRDGDWDEGEWDDREHDD